MLSTVHTVLTLHWTNRRDNVYYISLYRFVYIIYIKCSQWQPPSDQCRVDWHTFVIRLIKHMCGNMIEGSRCKVYSFFCQTKTLTVSEKKREQHQQYDYNIYKIQCRKAQHQAAVGAGNTQSCTQEEAVHRQIYHSTHGTIHIYIYVIIYIAYLPWWVSRAFSGWMARVRNNDARSAINITHLTSWQRQENGKINWKPAAQTGRKKCLARYGYAVSQDQGYLMSNVAVWWR